MKSIVTIVLLSVLIGTAKADSGVVVPKGTPIKLIVEDVDDEEQRLGLTVDYIRSKAELQLRRNGIRPVRKSPEPYYLYVNVQTVSSAFSVSVQFSRWVTYTVGTQEYGLIARTYDKSVTGMHAGDKKFIIGELLDLIDGLSNEILREAR